MWNWEIDPILIWNDPNGMKIESMVTCMFIEPKFKYFLLTILVKGKFVIRRHRSNLELKYFLG